VASPAHLLSIIVPVFNERRTVRAVIDRLLAVDLPLRREIAVVDDGSTDGTQEELQRAVEMGVEFILVQAGRNEGKGAAIRKGLERVRGSIIAIQDADLELDPAQIAALVEPIVRGDAQVVYGSRFMNGTKAPWKTRAANRALTGVTNVLYGSSLTDMETCYKLMRTDIARSLDLRANRFEIEPEITARLLRRGHRILELPVHFEPRSRAQGKKIRWHDGVQAVRTLVRERFL
jgi:glycosyltransferase involved in cell wall biosynthesis